MTELQLPVSSLPKKLCVYGGGGGNDAWKLLMVGASRPQDVPVLVLGDVPTPKSFVKLSFSVPVPVFVQLGGTYFEGQSWHIISCPFMWDMKVCSFSPYPEPSLPLEDLSSMFEGASLKKTPCFNFMNKCAKMEIGSSEANGMKII